MTTLRLSILLLAAFFFAQQPAGEDHARKIGDLTTDPVLLTELVDHLPASSTVPSPEKVLGYIGGAADKLTYAKDVHRYMREVEKTGRSFGVTVPRTLRSWTEMEVITSFVGIAIVMSAQEILP